MSEKRGFTGQLMYDFDTSKNLEIYFPDDDRWNRVTSRVFRSFNGKRRIQGENYRGPVYSYATNNLVDPQTTQQNKVVDIDTNWKSIRRPGENFY